MTAAPSIDVGYSPEAHGARCDVCPLQGRRPVPPTWPSHTLRLAIVGEGPGHLEVRKGEPFIGPSGALLNQVLEEVGINRDTALVTNAHLCQSDEDWQTHDAAACCSPRLASELEQLPKGAPIVALGKPAAKSVLGVGAILKSRGFVWKVPVVTDQQLRNAARLVEKRETPHRGRINQTKLRAARSTLFYLESRRRLEGRTVLPSVHPAFILRGADMHRAILGIDLDRVKRYMQAPLTLLDTGKFTECRKASRLPALLKGFGKEVVVDVETSGPDPLHDDLLCVGICDVASSRIVVAYPFRKAMAAPLKRFFATRVAIGHNIVAFDEVVLRRHGIPLGAKEDTLIAHHAFASHLAQSLAHVVSVYCDSGPWKYIFKAKGSNEKGEASVYSVDNDQLTTYNAADVRLTAAAWREMQGDLSPERRVYELDMRLASMCQGMQVAGIRIDAARQKQLSVKLRNRSAGLLGEMRSMLRRRDFHPSRLSDVRRALFSTLRGPSGLVPPTASGFPSTASTMLEALKATDTRAAILADYILRWRSAAKVRNTFVEGIEPGSDGRVHASWRSFGTVSGRPATRNPNILNLPRMQACTGCGIILVDGREHAATCKKRMPAEPEDQVRDMYVAARGTQWLYFDLSQAEMRMAASVSGDPNFIAACVKDVHAGNAIALFPQHRDILESDPKGKGKPYRDVAKSSGFAVTYLAGAETVFERLVAQGFAVSFMDVEDMLFNLQSTYKGYYRYVENNVESVQRTGYMRTPFHGRIRWFGWHPKPNEVANFPVQSGVADVMNERLLELEDRRPKSCKLILYAYDAAVYECPTREVATMRRLIKETWDREIVVPHNGERFKMPTDMKEGERWSDFG